MCQATTGCRGTHCLHHADSQSAHSICQLLAKPQEAEDRIARVVEAEVRSLRVGQQPAPQQGHKKQRRAAGDAGGGSPDAEGGTSGGEWQPMSDGAADDEAGSGSDDDSPEAAVHRCATCPARGNASPFACLSWTNKPGNSAMLQTHTACYVTASQARLQAQQAAQDGACESLAVRKFQVLEDRVCHCREEQARLQAQLAELDAAHAARLADMEALAAGSSRVSQLTQHYDRVLLDLATERDSLQKERGSLLQVRLPERRFRYISWLVTFPQ